jgi:beta/gamma crystallin
MRTILGLSALALLALPVSAALAQPQPGPPRGSYQRQCTDIRMNGQFLSATCRGARGGGQSSINIASCASDIGVDATGALSCAGPGAAAPAPPAYAPAPGYRDERGGGDRNGRGYGDRRERGGRDAVTVFSGRNWRGQAVRIDDAVGNLADRGLNDRIRSIQIAPRSGPWMVCSDAGFRGRCMTVERSVADTRDIGMRDSISSLRPLRDRGDDERR